MPDEHEHWDEPPDPDERVELEMVTRLIVAASESDEPLDDEDIDRLLGVGPLR
jgi:hypothetical protein